MPTPINPRAVAHAILVSVAALAVSPTASAQTTASPQAKTTLLEEVVVTGVRASLVKARDNKRDAGIVMDSIVAEDLGRFPDANVADSLSHITGITLQRTRGGEGQYVNVRGLGPEFSIVTLNGRILATDGDGREFAFDVLPAEVINGADVFKSSQASLVEGSIGGSINLSSARPLSAPGPHMSLTGEGDYSDLSEDSGYKASALYSNTFADDSMGLLISAVYNKVDVRSDAVHEFSLNPDSPGEFDANEDGEISEDETDLLGLCCTSIGSRIQRKERSAVTGAFQWKVNDAFEMTVDALFTRLNAPTVGYMESYYVEDSFLDEDESVHRWSNVSIDDHWVTDMTVAELIPEASTITEHRVVDTTQLGWNGAWQVNDGFKLNADVYWSESKRNSGGKDTWVVSGIAGHHTGVVHMNRNALPDISMTLEDGRDLETAFANGELGDDDWGVHYIGLSGTDVKDEVTGATVSGTLDVEWGPVSSFDFGVSSTERSKTRNTIENDSNGGSCVYCGNYQLTFADLGASVVRQLSLPHFMRNSGGHFPHSFVTFDVANYLDALRAADGTTWVDFDGVEHTHTFSSILPELNPVQSYDVKEDTTALYVQANIKRDRWFANAGVRWVSTDTKAKTAINRILSFVDEHPEIPTESPVVSYSIAEPFSQNGSYSKLLPSLNFGFWVNEDLILRFAAAKVLSRPSLNQLAPTATDGTLDRSFEIDYDGNADLEPVEATQADLSLEWYFDESSILNVAVFWKDITNFITSELLENQDIGVVGLIGDPGVSQTVLYDVSRPINGDKATVYGAEFGVQHFFSNGFGVRANYTYVDTTAYVDGVNVGQLEGVSESAYSLALIYEKGPWSAQIAADYSGEYTEVADAVGGLSQIGDPITWVTASAAYQLTDKIQVSLEGRNLGDAYYVSRLRADIPAGFETWGRTYILTVNAKL